MKILIVGGAGDIGKHLTKEYTQQGHMVRILDLAPKSPEMAVDPLMTYLQGNHTDKALVRDAVSGIDVVIDLAWGFADDPSTIFGTDIVGTANLLEAAASSGVRSFIYASTAVVYGRAVDHPIIEAHPCLIEEARKPFYALGKYAAEKLCLVHFKERKLPVTILRFWWAFGQSIGGRHLRDLIRTAKENRPLEMVRGAGGAFVTMNDLASAIRLVIGNPAAAGRTYNVGSLFLTWEEIGTMMIQETKSRSAVQSVPSDQWHGPQFLNEVWDLNWDKATNELGYEPQASGTETRALFREALKSCIAGVK